MLSTARASCGWTVTSSMTWPFGVDDPTAVAQTLLVLLARHQMGLRPRLQDLLHPVQSDVRRHGRPSLCCGATVTPIGDRLDEPSGGTLPCRILQAVWTLPPLFATLVRDRAILQPLSAVRLMRTAAAGGLDLAGPRRKREAISNGDAKGG